MINPVPDLGSNIIVYYNFRRTMRYHYVKSKDKELVPNPKKLIYELSPHAPFLRRKDTPNKQAYFGDVVVSKSDNNRKYSLF